jgi:tRNA pseudouridine55 synthase
MVLCLGQAVRLQQYLTGMNKAYEGEIRFGFATTTYDSEGEATTPAKEVGSLDLGSLNAALGKYTGEIIQSPPPFSAKRFAGKRFYELARAGLEVPKIEKKVKVMKFVFTATAGDRASFEIECGSGTYIRSLAHEVGADLALGGHLFRLCRTRIGDFTLDRAVDLETFRGTPPAERLQAPHFVALSDVQLPIPQVVMDNIQIRKLAHGQPVNQYDPDFPRNLRQGNVQLVNADRHFIGVGEIKTGESGALVISPKVILAP